MVTGPLTGAGVVGDGPGPPVPPQVATQHFFPPFPQLCSCEPQDDSVPSAQIVASSLKFLWHMYFVTGGTGVGGVVGAFVGELVGASVGGDVGAFVGALVGTFVGAFVGELVGLGVGGTGALVGTSVPPWVPSSAPWSVLP